MFALSAKQVSRIHRFQLDEITRLANDKAFAATCSQRPHYSRIGDWLPAGGCGRVLELGCGPGRFVAMLASMGYEMIGVDPFHYDTWEVICRAHSGIQLKSEIFAENLPYDSESFDHVVCIGALLYFENADRAFAEIGRVLKRGGRLVVRTINRGNVVRRLRGRNIDPGTKNVFSLSELQDSLAARGFKIRDGFSYGFFPPILTAYWWYLLNGPISIDAQERMSDFTPVSMRTLVTVFAEREGNGTPALRSPHDA
jgi:SAM-dependent methyltransferase